MFSTSHKVTKFNFAISKYSHQPNVVWKLSPVDSGCLQTAWKPYMACLHVMNFNKQRIICVLKEKYNLVPDWGGLSNKIVKMSKRKCPECSVTTHLRQVAASMQSQGCNDAWVTAHCRAIIRNQVATTKDQQPNTVRTIQPSKSEWVDYKSAQPLKTAWHVLDDMWADVKSDELFNCLFI